MRQNIFETIIGFAVLVVAVFFLTYTYRAQNKEIAEEYSVSCTFENVDGIIKGSDVHIGGIIVGKVESLTLDPQTYDAVLILSIDKKVKIPKDSRASIASSGFLGGKYVAITPGGDEEYLKDGERIIYTQSSINLESLIGKFMYSGGNGSEPKKSEPQHETNE